MIHLYNKCYLELDNKIDIDLNRYVISKAHGHEVWEKIKDIQRGTLFGYQDSAGSKDIVSIMMSMYFTVLNKDDKLVYYVDLETFPKFLASWYKFLLPNLELEEAANLYKAIVLYHNVYHRYVYQEQNSVEELVLDYDPAVFIKEFESLEDVKYNDQERYFRELIIGNTSFEFKIASFLYNESLSVELSDITRVLLTKEVENALIELREIFYSLFLRPEFSTKIGLSKTYDLTNANEVYQDGSKYVDLLFNSRIWKTSALSLASTNSTTVDVASLTEEDGQAFKDFITDIGILTSYDSDSIIQDSLYLTDYLRNIKEGFTIEEMRDFIVKEYKKVNSASIFNSTALPSVNSYLLDRILKNTDNLEVLKKYSLS